MPIENHAGFEGQILIGGLDFNITDGSMTETTAAIELFGTSDYDSVEDRAYVRIIRGVTGYTGSLSFNLDKNLSVATNLRSGSVYSVDFKTNAGVRFVGSIFIETIVFAGVGSQGAATTAAVTFRNSGKLTRSAA